jgi:hypothetical protein
VRDRVVGLVRHPVTLPRDRDTLADRALSLQPRCDLPQPLGLPPVPAHAAAREPRHSEQQHEERIVLTIAPDRLQRRQPGGRAEQCRQRSAQRRVGAHRVRRGENDEHERVRVRPPRRPERPVERRHEHRDAPERRDRQPPAERERQGGERGKRGAIGSQPVEHDLQLGRDQQSSDQAEILDFA